MRNGIYALLAVVVGVALIGVLPGQLSNLAVPTVETVTLQSRATASGNATLSGVIGGTNDANATYSDTTTPSSEQAASTAAQPATKSDTAIEGAGFTVEEVYDPYADVMYYGSWGIGLVAALGVYFIAKRMSG